LAPQGPAQNLRPRLEEFANNNELFLNPKFDWKITWMEEHQGRCFCDWEKRSCPCEHALEDLKRFNGICLCGVLCTKEKLLYYQKTMQSPKPLTPDEKRATKERLKREQKANLKLFDSVTKKKRLERGAKPS
jgi:hypothetical protein